jgi:agmatine deiminase
MTTRLAAIIMTTLTLAAASATTTERRPAGMPDALDEKLEFPPEWAPHDAIWMGWSQDTTHHPVQIEMMRAMLPHVSVRLMVVSDSMRVAAKGALRAAGIDDAAMEYVVYPIPNFWTRDPGPRFVTDGRRLVMAHFAWGNYGYANDLLASHDTLLLRRGRIEPEMAERLGLSIVSSELVAEGGGIEVSGDVLLTYRQTAMQRNPGVPIEQIEREYLRVYGKEKVVWLGRSPYSDRVFAGPKLANYFGMGANGHIDEFVRFVNDSTILIAQVDSADAAADALGAADRRILLENLEELKAARNVDGRPFHIIELPAPGLHHYMWTGPLAEWMKRYDLLDAVYRDFAVGDTIRWVPAASYMNFVITNGVVLVSKYWREGLPEREREKDEQARATLQRLFPDRRIVQIPALPVNFSGGGMHCIVQQQPRVAPDAASDEAGARGSGER